MHPAPDSLVVITTNEWSHPSCPKACYRDKELKRLDLYSWKAYSTTALLTTMWELPLLFPHQFKFHELGDRMTDFKNAFCFSGRNLMWVLLQTLWPSLLWKCCYNVQRQLVLLLNSAGLRQKKLSRHCTGCLMKDFRSCTLLMLLVCWWWL